MPDIEHWLDEFNSFSIMKILPEIMELLVGNLRQENEKKRMIENATAYHHKKHRKSPRKY